MAIISAYDWESDTWTQHHNESPDRARFRAAVAEISAKAHEKLPESRSRIDKAVALVLTGDVELLADGTAKVASQSNGCTAYHIVHGHCDCRDFERAPGQLCKHRLAFGLARRAQELTKAKLEGTNGKAQAEVPSQPAQPEAPTTSLPEAPVSITLKATLHGHEVLVTLRGTDFASVKVQVEQASQWLQAQSDQGSESVPHCPIHGVPLKRQQKNGRSWWSHKTPQGWCQGK
jgi:hypothetical protein